VRCGSRGTVEGYRWKVDTSRRLTRATLATVTLALAALGLAGPHSEGTPVVVTTPGDATSASVPPADPTGAGPTTVGDAVPVGTVPAGGIARDGPADAAPSPAPSGGGHDPPDAPTTPTPEGYLVLRGGSEAGAGPTVIFTVEIEPRTGIHPAEALELVEDALFDPRSWARDVRLVRIDDPEQAEIRLLFAAPSTVDGHCAGAGLVTHGIYSCWNGRFAAINSWRYAFGATGFDDRTSYRRYVVNHEVGHALGHGHLECPEPGAHAPLMLQQTASLAGCVANEWPYPER
jgi:hypothetical protein